MTGQLEAHPLADIFPLIEGREYADLVTDIREHGLREPIWLTRDGLILDGRNRALACADAGVEPATRTYEGDDLAAFVVSANLKRRHLNESQRAMVAARLANLDRGGDRKTDQRANLPFEPVAPQITTAAAADMLNVSERTVKSARAVQDRGAPELVREVEAGRVAVSTAADVATLPTPKQREIVARGEAEILQAAKDIRSAKARDRQEQNAALKAAAAPIPSGRHGVIVIDPPWAMQKIERDVRPNQVAFDYPTMSEAELVAFDVPGMAADDCHLFCWTTHKHLPIALRLIEAWGFRYVMTMVWHKPGGFQPIGLPQYNCEFAIYARRGSPDFSDTKAFFACFEAPRREHSRKPDEFYDTVRRVTVGPRIDVFSREAREGFAQYGNETQKFAGVA